jgi:hypothetical protein
MLMDYAAATLISAAAMFVIGFVVLFLIYYFTSPIYTEYGNRQSRLYYSLFNSLYFSIILAVLYAVLPTLSGSMGMIPSLGVGVIIIFIGTMAQVYIISALVKRGLIRMRPKARGRKKQPKE